MALYTAIHPTLEAIQWHKNGDHPDDHVINNINSGRVVGRHPTSLAKNFTSCMACATCQKPIGSHGILMCTGEIVCPGDYIEYNRGPKGRTLSYTLWKREHFETTYILQPVKVKKTK